MSDQKSGQTKDTTYNLISIVYHALQAVDTYHVYARDAAETGDTELATLLEGAMEQQRELAGQAKSLLAQRLASSGS